MPKPKSKLNSRPKRSTKDKEASLEIGHRIEYSLDKAGQLDVKYVPLTPAQALHPHEDDEFVASKIHSFAIQRLCEIADLKFDADPTYLSLTDTNVQFGEGFDDLRPDLILLLNAIRQRNLSLATFDYAKEPEPPRCPLVVEVTSPKTRGNDLVKKVGFYQKAGVEQYVIVDLPDPNLKEPRAPRILNYLLATHGRRRRPPRRDGRVLLECLETWIGFEGEDLLFTDSQTGRTFWKYSEAVREAEAAQARAEAAQARAEAAQARAEAAQVRADEEKARAEAEKNRADEEKVRAEAEKNRADEEKARAEAAQVRADEEKARAEAAQARADEEKVRAEAEKSRADEEKARAEELKERIRQLEELVLASQTAPRSGPSANGAPHSGP